MYTYIALAHARAPQPFAIFPLLCLAESEVVS